jgi:BlaI family penicillinase repressor
LTTAGGRWHKYYMPSSFSQLTDREADIMQILWSAGPSTVADVQAALADKLAYTTVLSLLRTLEAKGHVGHDVAGRGHRYFAAIPQHEAQRSALRHLTAKLFRGSTEALFTHIVADKDLTPEAARRLRTLLSRHTGEKS